MPTESDAGAGDADADAGGGADPARDRLPPPPGRGAPQPPLPRDSSGDDRSISADSLAILFETGPATSTGSVVIGSDSALVPPGTAPGDGTPTPPGPGSDTRRFERRGELGRGGMGMVELVYDHEIRREVARKRLNPGGSPDTASRFIEEGQITGQLEHPNIVPVHDMGVDAAGRRFITLKRVKGRSLRQLITSARLDLEDGLGINDDFGLEQRIDIFRKVLDAVAYAHSRGVIHRDIKPDNIMVGEFGEVLLMDWGLARIVGVPERIGRESLPRRDRGTGRRSRSASGRLVASNRRDSDQAMTLDGTMLGTPGYMPPEQVSGDREMIDERADVHALGAVLFELLTLSAPYTGETGFSRLQQMMHGKLESARERITKEFGRGAVRALEFTPVLEAIARRALEKTPAKRYVSVRMLAAELDAWRGHRRVSVYREPFLRGLIRWARRHPVPAVGLLAGVVLFCVISVFLVQLAEQHQQANEARQMAEMQERFADRQRQQAEMAAREARVSADEARAAGREALVSLDRAIDFRVTNALSAGDSLTAIAMLGGSRNPFARAARYCVPPPRVTWQASYHPRSLVSDVVFTADGRELLVALAHREENPAVVRIEPDAADVLGEIPVPRGPHRLLLDPADGGRRLLVGNGMGWVTAYDLDGSGTPRFDTQIATRPVTGLDLSPDGRTLAVASMDWTARMMDARDGTGYEFLLPTEGHSHCVAWTDAGFLLCGTDTGYLWFVHLASGDLLQLSFEGAAVMDVRITNRPGQEIAVLVADRLVTFSMADLQAGGNPPEATVHGTFRRATAFDIAPDNRTAIVAERNDLMIFDLDTPDADPERLDDVHTLDVTRVACSEDGRRIATASPDGWVHVWAVHPRHDVVIPDVQGHNGFAAFSPDGRLLAVPEMEGQVDLVDVATARVAGRITSSEQRLTVAVAWLGDGTLVSVNETGLLEQYTADGRRLASLRLDLGGTDHIASLRPFRGSDGAGWEDPLIVVQFRAHVFGVDLARHSVRWSFTHHDGNRPGALFVEALAAPDSLRRLWIKREDGAIELIDVETGEQLAAIESPRSGGGGSLVASPDNRWLVTGEPGGGFAARPADPARIGEVRFRSQRVINALRYGAFTPDGQVLMVADNDRMVFYDTDEWQLLRRLDLRTHSGSISPDGRFLVARRAGDNRTLLLGRWAPRVPDLAARISGRVRDRFTLGPLGDEQRERLLRRWPVLDASDIARRPDPAAAAFWADAWPAALGDDAAPGRIRDWLRDHGDHPLAARARRLIRALAADDDGDRDAAFAALTAGEFDGDDPEDD